MCFIEYMSCYDHWSECEKLSLLLSLFILLSFFLFFQLAHSLSLSYSVNLHYCVLRILNVYVLLRIDSRHSLYLWVSVIIHLVCSLVNLQYEVFMMAAIAFRDIFNINKGSWKNHSRKHNLPFYNSVFPFVVYHGCSVQIKLSSIENRFFKWNSLHFVIRIPFRVK